MYDLILYDTSDFQQFPIGGQLTSIRNFLRYLADEQADEVKRVLLLGITTDPEKVGVEQKIQIGNAEFSFYPVLYRSNDLAHVQKSLRLAYVQALLQHRSKIRGWKRAVHYIHTPEAYIAVKLICPQAKTAIFSHGSFFNMVAGFRFFQNNKLVHWGFQHFLVAMLREANAIFALDETSAEQYAPYNRHIYKVDNSIILPKSVPNRRACHEPTRLLFVGRLSKVKGIDQIVEAVARGKGRLELTILGDGEERDHLEELVRQTGAEQWVHLCGSCSPEQVASHMCEQDILVMNSVLEGKPMTILEAMSYGMPIVATPVGGIPEMVQEGRNARFTNGTPDSILEQVGIVSENYAVYAENACGNAKQYDYVTINESIFAILKQL